MSNLQNKYLGSLKFHFIVDPDLIFNCNKVTPPDVGFLLSLRSAVEKRYFILLPSICSCPTSRPGAAACRQCYGEVSFQLSRSAYHCACDYSAAKQQLPFCLHARSDV